MNAVIKVGGKQYYVTEGSEIFVEKLDVEAGATYTFDKVLLIGDESAKVGTPYIEGATVTAKVEKQGKSRKVRVFTYKSKAKVRRTLGHRQPYTCLTIEAINA